MNRKFVAMTLLSAGVLGLASCAADSKDPSTTNQGQTTVSITPGEAGGVIEDTFTVSATVNVIDPATRTINITASDGSKASLKAGPEIRNFDQIRVGDKITATVVERLVIFVRKGNEDPSVTHAAALARAPKGAKPGVLIGEAYETTATITAIDAINRRATIKFADGQTKTVTPRADVEMTQYKVGDTVVIRASETLSVIVETP